MTEREKSSSISMQTLKRLPYYLNYLKSLDREKIKIISSPAIAKALNMNEVQVRKDLASIKSGGRPKTGYLLEKLIKDLESYLGYDNVDEAVLVGAGHLGRALLMFGGFDSYGVRILAGFDTNENIVGTEISGKPVFSTGKLVDLCRRMHVHIGIITVTDENAQGVCDMLIEGGILAIWNFSNVQLTVPDGILVQNEDMASSLAVLSKHLKRKINS